MMPHNSYHYCGLLTLFGEDIADMLEIPYKSECDVYEYCARYITHNQNVYAFRRW